MDGWVDGWIGRWMDVWMVHLLCLNELFFGPGSGCCEDSEERCPQSSGSV